MSKGHFIHGNWIAAGGAEFFSRDPATGDVIWRGKAASSTEIDRAVSSARDALDGWANLSFTDRAEFLGRFAEKLRKQITPFTEAICLETGKPWWEAVTETEATIQKVAATMEAYEQRHMSTMRTIATTTAATRYKPHGVIAVLGPFNFPAHLPNGHIMPALLAGNAIVFKPSEMTPLVGEMMVDIWNDVGLPGGVINLIQGERDTGARLVNHIGIDGVFFTGSFDAGRAINRVMSDRAGKIVALEMGGNNPLVIHRAYDFEAAAYWTIQSAYLTAGQRCSCARRLIIVDEGKQTTALIERLMHMIGRIIVGRYTDTPEPFMGPVISNAAAEKILGAQQDLIARGGRALIPCQTLGPRPAMISPGLIDVTNVRDRADEEIFGPLLQVILVRNFDEAINEANNTRYGLAAGLLCEDQELWELFYQRIRAGVVNWNRPLTGASSLLPFGGVGRSGNHRPSAFFALDYCSYPVASLETETLELPPQLTPGLMPRDNTA